MSNGRPEPPPPDDPVPWWGTFFLGIAFLALAFTIFYFLVATWPVPAADPKEGFAAFSIFGRGPFPVAPDLRIFFTVIAAGALGSLIHTVTSFADYVGNRRLSRSWIWWLVLRTPVGIALALLFYLVLRGGLIVPTLPGNTQQANATQLLNPYGIAAISALAGMFSKQATDKLREIFDTLFRTQQPVERADPLAPATPVISGTDPVKLTVNKPQELTVQGSGFQPDCEARVNGKSRDVERVSDTLIKVTLLAEDVATKGNLQLIVQNPDGERSSEFTIVVDDQ